MKMLRKYKRVWTLSLIAGLNIVLTLGGALPAEAQNGAFMPYSERDASMIQFSPPWAANSIAPAEIVPNAMPSGFVEVAFSSRVVQSQRDLANK